MRSPIARLAESCAYLMNDLERTGQRSVPIINAGSGADEHPTQALLDIYTLQRTFNFENPTESPVERMSGGRRIEELRSRFGYADLTPGLANKTLCLLRRYWQGPDRPIAGHVALQLSRRATRVCHARSSEIADA